MASTFTSDQAASSHSTKDNMPGTNTVIGRLTTTVAPVINDIFQMVKVPKGARVTEMVLSVTDADTNVGPAIVLDVGDGGDPNRFIASSAIGQTGGTVRLGSGITTLTHGFTYLVDDTIDILVQVAPATGVAAVTFELAVTYVTDTAAIG